MKEKEKEKEEIKALKDDIAKKEAKIEETENELNELKDLQKKEPKPFLETQILALRAQITTLNDQILEKEKRLTFLTGNFYFIFILFLFDFIHLF